VEQKKQDEQDIVGKSRKKWKFWAISASVVLLGLLVVIPPFYAEKIWRPLLIDRFQKITNNQYSLEFKSINWSILSNSILIKGLQIKPMQNDSLNRTSPTISSFQLNRLSFAGLNYSSLLDANIQFEKLLLDSLNIAVKLHKETDSILNRKEKALNKQMVLPDIFLKNLDLKKINLRVDIGNDSVIICENMESHFDDFVLKENAGILPEYKKFSLAMNKMQWSKSDKTTTIDSLVFTHNALENKAFLAMQDILIEDNLGAKTVLNQAEVKINADSLFTNLWNSNLDASILDVHLMPFETKTTEKTSRTQSYC